MFQTVQSFYFFVLSLLLEVSVNQNIQKFSSKLLDTEEIRYYSEPWKCPILDSSKTFKQCFKILKDSFWIKQSLEFLKISKAATTLLALATGKQITYGTLTKWAKNLTNLILCTVPHCVAGGSICQKILACMQPETFQETLLILSRAFF